MKLKIKFKLVDRYFVLLTRPDAAKVKDVRIRQVSTIIVMNNTRTPRFLLPEQLLSPPIAPATPNAKIMLEVLVLRFLYLTLIIPSGACCAQYYAFFAPDTPNDGRLLQRSVLHFLSLTSTIPSGVCCVQYFAVFVPASPFSVIGSLFDGQGLVRKKWCCASGLLGWWPVVTGLLQKIH